MINTIIIIIIIIIIVIIIIIITITIIIIIIIRFFWYVEPIRPKGKLPFGKFLTLGCCELKK